MMQTGEEIDGKRTHLAAVRKVLPVGKHVWSSSEDQKILIWDGEVLNTDATNHCHAQYNNSCSLFD
jgi:hypothetical protein